MTVIDLIRKLHKEGTVILGYEIYTTTDLIDVEDAVYRWNVNPSVMRDVSHNIDPGSIELGDRPEYLVCFDPEEYEEYTGVELPKARYPRLLVCVCMETMWQFSGRWKGHHWTEIPPVELDWSQVSYYHALPQLSRDGIFVGYEDTFPGDRKGSYYVLKSKYGSFFAWRGDILRDGVPDGMSVEDAGMFI